MPVDPLWLAPVDDDFDEQTRGLSVLFEGRRDLETGG
jgi:hypothetical protein